MGIELIIGLVVVVVIVGGILLRSDSKDVPKDYKAPLVHNEVQKGQVGPAPVVKEEPKKVTKKAPVKKTTKKKAAPKKATKSVDLSAMTKTELDIYARNELDLKLDRRKTKDFMIEQIENHIKEK
jgi:hypothetical protein